MTNKPCPGFRANWRSAADDVRRIRRRMWRDAEVTAFISSYVAAPILWIITLVMVTYFTFKQHRQQTKTIK